MVKYRPISKYRPIEIQTNSNYKDDAPDYHFICDVNTPKKDRDRMFMGDVYANMAKCLECGDIIRSKNKHDYRSCSCGKLSVDGGSHYLKRAGDNYEELSIMFTDTSTPKIDVV